MIQMLEQAVGFWYRVWFDASCKIVKCSYVLRILTVLLNIAAFVSQMLGQFIARAIADHVLPMDFLDCHKGKVDCEHARWPRTSRFSVADPCLRLPIIQKVCRVGRLTAFVVLSRVALDRAAVLLSMKREMVRLDNVWGVGGGLRPVKHLVKEVSSGLFLKP